MRKFTLLSLSFLLGSCSTFDVSDNKPLGNGNTAISFYNTSTEQTVFAKNENQLFNPASCLKIITCTTALEVLGPDFTFETGLYYNPKSHDLSLVFDGDPTLTSDDLKTLFSKIPPSMKIRHIHLINPNLETPEWNEHWMIEDQQYKYASTISCAIIDKNLVSVSLTPQKLNEAPVIQTELGYEVGNHVITHIDEPSDISNAWVEGKFHLKGKLDASKGVLDIKLPAPSLKVFAERKMNEILHKHQFKISGKVDYQRSLVLRDHLHLIAKHNSASLKEILIPAMKDSDNIVFEALFLKVAMTIDPIGPTSWEKCGKTFKEIAESRLGIDLKEARIIDGSGLSRKNLISAEHLQQLLRKFQNNKEFHESLALSGTDGTLKNRLKDIKVYGKTGMMSNVNCLCGYIETQTHEDSFVIMMQNYTAPAKELRDAQDQILMKYHTSQN